MVVGLGIDICENDRISEMLGKYSERFLRRVFTDEEIAYCMKKKDPIPHLAARFAVKEAFIKALGMPRDLTISYRDVGLRGSEGKKDIHVTGKLAQMLETKRATSILFSISHARDYSNACVVLEQI
ncbi:MAG TPA: holo-ACP synthase [Turneriella sp.]|nr:holo-ACP synthase [Turneriella sp.]HNA78069.1 holo-ACP synthase [Turneriella sp.]HNE18741.1 holo-ACP synthase [Turneriella sp.]HNJ66294.1 holo-ACP synthase [Turneriella sp.]HNL09739.1 holo-ACP synthase [Turneriella sp.]